MERRLEWEHLVDRTQRLAVIGGWLIKNETLIHDRYEITCVISESMCFAPDANHVWLNKT